MKELHPASERAEAWVAKGLDLAGPEQLYLWQRGLLARFLTGDVPSGLELPTGLGKTAVMPIWLAARAAGASVPRRLVYVVDRRAVVDQATEVAQKLREVVGSDPAFKSALGLAGNLPISTLRGQFADNREWREDPSSPAIIVGTVDMIGSRLLFQGYGVSRKSRPYHAGLLGIDALIVLDEAHISQPFLGLLRSVEEHVRGSRAARGARFALPPLQVMAMSATRAKDDPTAFRLREEDRADEGVRKRLDASKVLTVEEVEDSAKLAESLADRAWKLSGEGASPTKILVYCDRRRDADDVAKSLRARGEADQVILLVGARRVFERAQAWDALKRHGFVGSERKPQRAVFLVATSAGEVGVDADADHMVCDLVPWERMAQRLGRVNRRGESSATVTVFVHEEAAKKDSEKVRRQAATRNATRRVLDNLPSVAGGRDASPAALLALPGRVGADLMTEATTRAPLRPALTPALVEAWAMTTLKEHTARPDVQPWLRGWEVGDEPETTVVWRKHLPVRRRDGPIEPAVETEVEDFFDEAPPHLTEQLETMTPPVAEWLIARAKKIPKPSQIIGDQGGEAAPFLDGEPVAFILSSAGDRPEPLTLHDLGVDDAKDRLTKRLIGKTLVVSAKLGGLVDGLLDPNAPSDVEAAAMDAPNTSWPLDPGLSDKGVPIAGFRVRMVTSEEDLPESDWIEVFRFESRIVGDEPREWIVVERHLLAAENEALAPKQAQRLADHAMAAERRMREIAVRLGLSRDVADVFAFAALHHDDGKDAPTWQRAFRAPKEGGPYAKTRGPINQRLLAHYRHELGSILRIQAMPELAAVPEELRDLVLHVIIAHHGQGRPLIDTRGCDRPQSTLAATQEEVALRFARLQKAWGPWGLAWWEAQLRAADQMASRDNDAEAI